MKKAGLFLLIAMIVVVGVFQLRASDSGPGIAPAEALKMLKDGNARCAEGKPQHPHQDQQQRSLTTSKGQHPFATIVGCSDSRVPPEILFDSGIGDIFVIRVAGNVADVDEVGSIEYGVDHLGTPVLVILGHTKCGAVTAVTQGAEVHGNIPALVDNIIPAVAKAKEANPGMSGDALINEAIRANVWQSVEDLLRTSPVTKKRVKDGKLEIVGAIYDIESGKIEWLGNHPQQAQLLAQADAPQPAHGDAKEVKETKEGGSHAEGGAHKQ